MKHLIGFLGLLLLPLSGNAALVCTLNNNPILDFGSPDPFVGGNITTTAALNWSCTENSGKKFTGELCFFVAADSQGDIDPRHLENGGPQPLPFNVYRDATHTTVIQPTTDAAGVAIDIPKSGPYTVSGTVTLYGMLQPLLSDVQTGLHQTVMTNSQIHFKAGNSGKGCDSAKGGPEALYTLTAQVNIPNQCQVTATDLDFGTQATPLLQTDSQSNITVRCTNTTLFSVGLNGGLSGNRELTSGSNTVAYELYQDTGRTTVWNNTSGRQSGTGLGTTAAVQLMVFGRIFADPAAAEGVYTDTITVDVTF